MLQGGYESDDIQLLSADPLHGESLRCQICFVDLKYQTGPQRQAHYDRHFSDEAGASSSASSAPHMKKPAKDKLKAELTFRKRPGLREQNVFWYPAQSSSPPYNFTPGLITVLKRALMSSHARGNTQRAVLCYERTVHVATERWDIGWGCGFRNFLMACTALMDQPIQPMYFPILDHPSPPGVRNLQCWIEDAWLNGFDPEGAEQLKRHLVDTSKWIGSAELYAAFSWRGIPAQLVDFDISKEGVDMLTEWVVNHFTTPAYQNAPQSTVNEILKGASPVICTDMMPLVLQHSGHSRTIIGYEVSRTGVINLLMFDPSKKPSADLRQAALSSRLPPRNTGATAAALEAVQPPLASRALHRVLHPREHHEAKKRKAAGRGNTDDAENDPVLKRARAGAGPEDPDEIVCLDGPPAGGQGGRAVQEQGVKLDASKVINFFRANYKQLGRKDKYQILYFPLTEPLTEQQRLQRRTVTSEKVC